MIGGSSQLITDLNFDTLLQTTFDGTTGFTTFTAVAEPTNCVLADVDMNGQVFDVTRLEQPLFFLLERSPTV